jgi:hypothetical protein
MFFVQRKQSQAQRIILLRNALTTAQILASFAKMQPAFAECEGMFGNTVSEALRLVNATDDVILRVCHVLILTCHLEHHMASQVSSQQSASGAGALQYRVVGMSHERCACVRADAHSRQGRGDECQPMRDAETGLHRVSGSSASAESLEQYAIEQAECISDCRAVCNASDALRPTAGRSGEQLPNRSLLPNLSLSVVNPIEMQRQEYCPVIYRCRLSLQPYVQSFETLKATAGWLLEDQECNSKIMLSFESTLNQIGVATAASNESNLCTNAKQIQQRLNSTGFIRGLHRMLSLFSAYVPDSLGLALVQHLSGWVNPSEMLRPVVPDPQDTPEQQQQKQGPLPAEWSPGDELQVPAALLDLFHLLPPSSKELLQTCNNRHGLVVLTIELEQVPLPLFTPDLAQLHDRLCTLGACALQLACGTKHCCMSSMMCCEYAAWALVDYDAVMSLPQVLEKHMHAESHAGMSSIKLWSPLRPPLLRFLCQHLSEAVHYFFNMDDCRLFQPDYFWLLHDLALHDLGSVLLDAICSSEGLWVSVLDRILHDSSELGAAFSHQAFRVLHLMTAIVERRPGWLTERTAIWPKVLALWDHPNRAARLAEGYKLSNHARAESHMLAKLVLSFLDKNKAELPRICDLFTLFEHPVRLAPSAHCHRHCLLGPPRSHLPEDGLQGPQSVQPAT